MVPLLPKKSFNDYKLSTTLIYKSCLRHQAALFFKQLQITNYGEGRQLRITNYELRGRKTITNYELRITNYELRITNYGGGG